MADQPSYLYLGLAGETGPGRVVDSGLFRLADGDKPSKVTVDDGDGVILEERLFGTDLSQEIGA